MKKHKILYFIRSEADLERIVSISIPGKNYADQYFVYYGDIDFIFDKGIKNKFQKHLLESNSFFVLDIVSITFLGNIYKFFRQRNSNNKLFNLVFLLIIKIIKKYLISVQNKYRLANKVLKKYNPTILITDNSEERENYFPHLLRQAAIKKGIKVHVTGHGPAGGLHKEYYSYEFETPDAFNNCIVGICSKHDYGYKMDNRIITGDPADGFPHLLYKHSQNFDDINFLNNKKYKIGFFMAAPFETCTNSWSIMEEIMLDYSFNNDVSMVAKFHPRLYKLGDYRYLKKIDNLKLYGPELDRSRLVKWADIIICSDHCSMLFEGMIFNKKVVAVHSKKASPFKKYKSKIHGCDPSMNSIKTSAEFNINNLTNYTSDSTFIDKYCWGNLGKIDLGENIIKKLIND